MRSNCASIVDCRPAGQVAQESGEIASARAQLKSSRTAIPDQLPVRCSNYVRAPAVWAEVRKKRAEREDERRDMGEEREKEGAREHGADVLLYVFHEDVIRGITLTVAYGHVS